MSHRTSLAIFPTPRACVAAIDALAARFKAEFRRRPTVVLFVSTTFPSDAAPPTYSVTLYAEVLTEQTRAEIAWFTQAASTLT